MRRPMPYGGHATLPSPRRLRRHAAKARARIGRHVIVARFSPLLPPQCTAEPPRRDGARLEPAPAPPRARKRCGGRCGDARFRRDARKGIDFAAYSSGDDEHTQPRRFRRWPPGRPASAWHSRCARRSPPCRRLFGRHAASRRLSEDIRAAVLGGDSCRFGREMLGRSTFRLFDFGIFISDMAEATSRAINITFLACRARAEYFMPSFTSSTSAAAYFLFHYAAIWRIPRYAKMQ